MPVLCMLNSRSACLGFSALCRYALLHAAHQKEHAVHYGFGYVTEDIPYAKRWNGDDRDTLLCATLCCGAALLKGVGIRAPIHLDSPAAKPPRLHARIEARGLTFDDQRSCCARFVESRSCFLALCTLSCARLVLYAQCDL
eukprot:5379795-Pleurochrysis_carterae.AAC.3